MSSLPACTIDFSHSSFKNGTKDAKKRHHSFLASLATVIKSIETDPMTVGDQTKSTDPTHHVRKVRVGCPNESVPERKGYRVIYQVLEVNGLPYVRMLDCYYKPNQADISADAVKRLIDIAPPTP